jgi:hypothetical protein
MQGDVNMAAANAGHAGFGPRPLGTWEQTQAWRSARRAMRERFVEDGVVLRSGLATAWTDRINGMFDLAIDVAIDRVNAASKVQAASARASAWNNKAPPTKVYAGASTIDLDNDTVTLGDGTTLDIHTGLKVDVTI